VGITATGNVEVELQNPNISTEKIYRTSQRLMLGLVAESEKNRDSIFATLDGPTSGNSRPDAWLYGKDFVVLIESKVGKASLELDQMRCHYQKLKRGADKRPDFQVHTWVEIHQFFVKLLSTLEDKNKLLVEQFIQYLEYKNMSEFSGFEEAMFEFFVHAEKDPDTKQWIRNTMDLFGEKVLHYPNGLQALNASFYETQHVGNFGSEDDHFWVAFGPEKFGGKAHQTIALFEYGLEIFANVEQMPAIKKLRAKMSDEEPKFREIVSKLPEPFRVWVGEKKQNHAMIFDYYPIATLEGGTRKLRHPGPYGLKDPKSDGFDCLKTLLGQLQFPCFSVRKRIDRKHVLELSLKGNADTLVDEVVAIMRAFHSLVEFING
jgi:hypothetical protein